MSLHLSVILFTRGGVSQHAMGQTHLSDTTGYGQQEGGTHPTRIHTCLKLDFYASTRQQNTPI